MALLILQYRKQKGLTQEQVAEMIGVARSTFTEYETGAAEIRYSTLCKIAKALGVPVTQLITEEPVSHV